MIINSFFVTEIINKIKNGDEKAFEELFRTYYKPLCQYTYRILKDPVTAEEIVQDIFYHIWEKRQTLEPILSVKSYLYKAVSNNALKYLRHNKIVNAHQEVVQHDLLQSFNLQENYSEMNEIIHIIEETMNSVPERTHIIFSLHRDQGLKYKEIAQELNISVKTVEAHMTYLLKLLRENLRDYMFLIIIIIFFIG